MDTFEIIVRYREGFLSGLFVTLRLGAITWAFGLTVGTMLGASAYIWPRWAGWPLRGFSVLLAGIPFLVLLYWANYPLQELFGIIIDPFATAAGLLCLINIVLVAEIWRGALNDFPKEYVIAGKVTGLNTADILQYIQLPILFRQVLPSVIASQVAMLQLTLFASLISVEELFRVSQRINASIQKPIEIYTALAIFFFALSAPLYGLAYVLRSRFTRDLSET